MSTRLLRANSSARDGVSKSSRLSLPSIWRTISASSSRLQKRSSTIRTVLRCARANASSETTPSPAWRRSAAHAFPPPVIMAYEQRTASKNGAYDFASQPSRLLTAFVNLRGLLPMACYSRDDGARPGETAGSGFRAARPFHAEWSGRSDSNLDPLHPMQVRYQAALRPDRTADYTGGGVHEARRSWRISSSSCRISAGSKWVRRGRPPRWRCWWRRAAAARARPLRIPAGGVRR